MHEINPKILTDANQEPVAVQIDYADWVEIKRLLGLSTSNGGPVDLNRFAGALKRGIDGLDFQRQTREEWDR